MPDKPISLKAVRLISLRKFGFVFNTFYFNGKLFSGTGRTEKVKTEASWKYSQALTKVLYLSYIFWNYYFYRQGWWSVLTKCDNFITKCDSNYKLGRLFQSRTGVPLKMAIIVELWILHHSKYAILFLKFYAVAKCPPAGHGLKLTKSPTTRTDRRAFNILDFSNFLHATRVVSYAIFKRLRSPRCFPFTSICFHIIMFQL